MTPKSLKYAFAYNKVYRRINSWKEIDILFQYYYFFSDFFLYILYLDLFHSVAVTFIVVVAIKIDIT